MTHRRKHFLVYPPFYDPMPALNHEGPPHPPGKPWASVYRVFASKKRAFRQATRWGAGSEVLESVHIHPRRHTSWVSSSGKRSWTIEHKEQT